MKKEKNETSTCLKPCSGLFVTSFGKSQDKKNIQDIFPNVGAYNKFKKISLYPTEFPGNHTFTYLE